MSTPAASSKPSTRQPDLLVDRERERAARALHPLAAKPALGAREELARDLGVVDGVEEAEEARVVVVALEVLAIDLRGDATDALAVAVRGEDGALGVLEEGVLLRVEPILQVHVERADVVRIVLVDVVDDVQEVLERPPHRGLANLDHAQQVAAAAGPSTPCA